MAALSSRRTGGDALALGTETVVSSEFDTRLAGCCGYRVDGPDGRIGYVAAVQPDAIEVRVGLFARRTFTVPSEAIATVSLARRVLVLREPPSS